MIHEREEGRSQIRVQCLFFAGYRDSTGTEELEVYLPTASSVADLVGLLRERLGMEALPARPVVAVGQEYASSDRVLAEGDEVAFIPPVAGG